MWGAQDGGNGGTGSTSPGSPDQDRCVLGILTSWDYHVVMVREEDVQSGLAALLSLTCLLQITLPDDSHLEYRVDQGLLRKSEQFQTERALRSSRPTLLFYRRGF